MRNRLKSALTKRTYTHRAWQNILRVRLFQTVPHFTIFIERQNWGCHFPCENNKTRSSEIFIFWKVFSPQIFLSIFLYLLTIKLIAKSCLYFVHTAATENNYIILWWRNTYICIQILADKIWSRGWTWLSISFELSQIRKEVSGSEADAEHGTVWNR